MGARMLPEHDAGSLCGLYEEIRRKLGVGTVPHIFQAMAAVNADVLVQNWIAYRRTMLEGDLPRQLKEMVALAVAAAAGSSYCGSLHRNRLSRLGVPRRVVEGLALQGDSEHLPRVTRAALRFAWQFYRSGDKAGTGELEAAGFTEDEVQELEDVVLMEAGMCRFAAEADLPLDPA